jgi:hypothetical protein
MRGAPSLTVRRVSDSLGVSNPNPSEPPLAETSLSRAHRLRLSLAALALALLALATATALAVWVAAAIFHTPPGGLA